MKEKDNTKSRNRGTNKAVRNKVRQHRKRVHTREHVNRVRKLANNSVTALGLFVALLKERGFQRHPDMRRTYYKEVGNGDTQLVVLDYIKDKAALLLCGDGSGPVVEHVLYYEEQPLAKVTVQWLERKERQKEDDKERARVRSKIKQWEKEAPRTAEAAWKSALKSISKE